jgi:hypothetical protein
MVIRDKKILGNNGFLNSSDVENATLLNTTIEN